ncbi:serine hydrolase domain-containing protein [Teredinibacter franksiae]|uniref:serine hydrolase domain-containing protein n=1 Tax=Teredinibacter franksiae TaxID=2761453 RepID=UPI001C89F89E|nr:serine hydrolase domain-containing protein [Teredinibacter franksiae]
MHILRLTILACTSLLLAACGGGNSENPLDAAVLTPNLESVEQCARSDIESILSSRLASASTDTDFTFYLESSDGQAFSYSRGNADLTRSYESASTSKWVSAAIILQVVDRGLMALDDHPQDYLPKSVWDLPEDSVLKDITLAQLLSFTSGLDQPQLCDNLPNADFFQCVSNIADDHLQSTNLPGGIFHYGSNHLQVAGAMAVEAGGYSSWLELFDEFKAVTGLFPSSHYSLPSQNNPRLAGGMTWTATDYIDFIRAFRDADFYSSTAPVEQATSDQIVGAVISNSPAMSGISEDWHYGFGLWIECHESSFNSTCAETPTVSSPGAYGAYPFLNTSNGAFGLIARQGQLGSFREGYALLDGVRDLVDNWAECQ